MTTMDNTSVIDNAPKPPASAFPNLRSKDFNHLTRTALLNLRDRENLTTTTIAKELGYSAATVSRYLNGKPEGDVTKLEAMIEEFVTNFDKRRVLRSSLFETAVSEDVKNALDTIRDTTDIALIYGRAGLGKTCGCQLYASENTRATMITVVRQVRNSPKAIIRALLEAGGTRYTHNRPAYDVLVEKFKDTNRLIIIDNAHLLSRSGLGFVFDFYDDTKSPIALVGNPEILDRIKQNDQQNSRLGVKWEVTLPKNTVEAPTKRIIQEHFPSDVQALYKLCRQVIQSEGHLRALKKQLLLTQKILKGDPSQKVTDAFKAAHEMLVRNYRLLDI